MDTSTASEPRRGFVFALIGGGILAVAIGGGFALYALATNLLGSPIGNWPYIARAGASAFVVGVIILGLYLWTARHEHLFSGLFKRPEPVEAPGLAKEEPAAQSSTLEGVLDELLSGKITRDQAAARIRSMAHVEPSPT